MPTVVFHKTHAETHTLYFLNTRDLFDSDADRYGVHACYSDGNRAIRDRLACRDVEGACFCYYAEIRAP